MVVIANCSVSVKWRCGSPSGRFPTSTSIYSCSARWGPRWGLGGGSTPYGEYSYGLVEVDDLIILVVAEVYFEGFSLSLSLPFVLCMLKSMDTEKATDSLRVANDE